MARYSVYILLLTIFWTSCCSEEPITLPTELRITSQEDLDMYSDALRDVTVFEGNIELAKQFENLPGSTITDISAFCNLRQINGNLTIVDYVGEDLGAFKNLEKVSGIVSVSNDFIVEVDLPALAQADAIIITFASELRSVNLPSLSEVEGTIAISDNANLENIRGMHNLLELQNLTIANNPALNKIDAFNSLTTVRHLFALECYGILDLAQPNLNALSAIDRLQLTIIEEDGIRLDWLDLSLASSVFVRAVVDLEDLCDLRNIATYYPDAIIINQLDSGLFFYSGDLLLACD